jgi:hypothetical protein
MSQTENYATKPAIWISAVVYDKPVGKRLELSEDGKTLRKLPLLEQRGKAGKLFNRAFDTAKEAFEFRLQSSACWMFLSGTFNPCLVVGRVVPQAAADEVKLYFEAQDRSSVVSLTKDQLDFRQQGGLITIDIDHKNPD